MIDHNSNIPYYVQLTNAIQERIQNKEWAPGSKIPGEMELCEEAGVSRTVVRQALRELQYGGLIIRRKGKGTFVAEPKVNESLVAKLMGSYQDMAERGLRSTSRVLHHRVVAATEKVAAFLNLEAGAKVVDIFRLRFVEDTPMQLANTFIPLALCPGLADIDLTNRSLYEFLEKDCGIWISRGHRYIEAVAASDIEAKFLGVARGAPLVALDSISYLEDGTPIEYYHAVHRGDRSRFEVELLRTRSSAGGDVTAGVDINELPPSDPNVKAKPDAAGTSQSPT
jgi:GntR family transcriptional regulator